MSLKVNKYPPRRSRPVFDIEGALETGFGLKKTKSGAGDKEVSYIVQQNQCLKFVLVASVTLVLILSGFLSYIHWFNYIKWDAVSQEVLHHFTENDAQARLELKKAAETVLHQSHRLAEYKSYLELTLGDNVENLKIALREQSHLSQEFTDRVISDNDIVGSKVIRELDAILKQFNNEYRNAQLTLKRLPDAIIANADDDIKDHAEYHKKLADYGANNENLLSKVKNKWSDFENKMKGSKNKVKDRLEKFFSEVNEVQFPVLDQAIIVKWERFLTKAVETLKDDSKETDIRKLIKDINKMILEDTSGEVKLFDSRTDRSIIDYLKNTLNNAKLAPHRQEIMQLYNDWNAGKKKSTVVLREIESLSKNHASNWFNLG